MALTTKDKEFLEKLRLLMESHDLSVELRADRPSYLVLRGTYGQKINQAFRMSRQGVRWRFWRLFNEKYVNAFEVILFIEALFGAQLRDHAVRISQERHALRQACRTAEFMPAETLAKSETSRDGGGAA